MYDLVCVTKTSVGFLVRVTFSYLPVSFSTRLVYYP